MALSFSDSNVLFENRALTGLIQVAVVKMAMSINPDDMPNIVAWAAHAKVNSGTAAAVIQQAVVMDGAVQNAPRDPQNVLGITLSDEALFNAVTITVRNIYTNPATPIPF